MKKIILVLIAVLLCASFAEAYVYRTIGKVNPRGRSFSTGATVVPVMYFATEGGLGATKVTWHPYTIGNREVTSTRPGTPGVLSVEVRRKASASPPITEGVTILATAYYPDGTYENFGTADIEGIPPLNVLTFDHHPDVQAYTNDKQVAKGSINTVIKYVVLVKYKDEARVFGMNLNVR